MALDKLLSVRVTDVFKKKFNKKAKKYGSPSEVHREIVEAFTEDRISVKPNPNKPTLEKLYEH